MNIQTAKDLIAKGIEYGDPDLVDMGNLMLEKFFNEKESSNESFQTTEPKKKRGRPKKETITTEETKNEPKVRNTIEDFTAPSRNYNNLTEGEDDRRLAKKRQIKINIKPMTLDEHREDSKIDAVLSNPNYKPKYREKFTGYNLVCNTCEKQFKSDIFGTTCQKCLKGKIR